MSDLDLYDHSAVHMVCTMPKNFIRLLPREQKWKESSQFIPMISRTTTLAYQSHTASIIN